MGQGRYIWRHNTLFTFPALSLKVVDGSLTYADIPGFPSPSIVTGKDLGRGLLYIPRATAFSL